MKKINIAQCISMTTVCTGSFLVVLMASFCIAVPGTAWGGNHSFLKANGVDDEEVAKAYYRTIDPNNLRMTQQEFEDVNGFNDPRNTVVDVRGYKNEGDLGFWRSIRMVRDKRPGYEDNIAFTTANYETEAASLAGKPTVSIVNMEYSPGPEDDMLTKFYVFEVDDVNNNGKRLTSTSFDGIETLYLPAACYSCHGGDDDAESPLAEYNEGSGETNATFLLIDVATQSSNTIPMATLEVDFKKVNEAVLDTDPSKATRALIKGLYGGPGLPRDTQDLSYIPSSWVGEEQLYREVIIPSCRNCHTTSDTKLLRLSHWMAKPGGIREEVFHELNMPNSRPVFNKFWMDTNQQMILDDALTRFGSP